MITLLSRIFLRGERSEEQTRSAYGKLCGIVGIFLNLLLFAGKFFAGLLSGSIAVTADAFNNLSDAGSSVVSLVSFRISEQKPDAKHPYGHGRIEYIAGLIISAVIIIMAYELIKDSVGKIIHPEETEWSIVVLVILIASILVKCYMAFYNARLGKRYDAAALRATAIDSLSDCVATTVVLLCTVLSHLFGWKIDGFAGVLVGGFILLAGIRAAKDVINPLLGEPPEKEYVDSIEQLVLAFDPAILGVHDLMVHDYGPGRRVISLHAEVPAEGNILELHDIIDNLEHSLSKELGCVATIHMDPVVTGDPRVDELRYAVTDILASIDERISMHDFRVVFGPSHTNLIFDIVLPFDYPTSEEDIVADIDSRVKAKLGPTHFTVIQVDRTAVK
ncbi:MAG: cation diffusion facilitator family transporter [Lachnospiraceae bacterium]|nr:cation diffusion facilitator family transporter [Lachnospiraceae bacterium]